MKLSENFTNEISFTCTVKLRSSTDVTGKRFKNLTAFTLEGCTQRFHRVTMAWLKMALRNA